MDADVQKYLILTVCGTFGTLVLQIVREYIAYVREKNGKQAREIIADKIAENTELTKVSAIAAKQANEKLEAVLGTPATKE